MSNKRSVGNFCSLTATNLTGTSDSIAAFNGSLLGEGAEAYCTSSGHAYRWTSAVIAATTAIYIAPNAGGGTWVVQDGNAFFSGLTESTLAYEGASITPTVNVWNFLPTGGGFYAGTGPNVVWTTNSSNGVMTYGSQVPSNNIIYLVTGQVTLYSGSTNQDLEFAFSPSAGNIGSLIGTTTGRAGGSVIQQALSGTAITPLNFSISILSQLTPGVGYQWVFRNLTGSNAILSLYYGMSIVPVGKV